MQGRLLLAALLLAVAPPVAAQREFLLKQVDLPHGYYWRELYLPQLTTGPSSAAFMPDGETLVYSMGGSLWRQVVGSGDAVELTHANGAYDYQPDVSSDGKSVIFSRYTGAGYDLWRLDLASGRSEPLTRGDAVNVEPRISPDGRHLAWVSTKGTGHFNLFVADLGPSGLANARPLLGERKSKVDRYYYSAFDHALSPSWSPDGKRLLYVSNNEVAWGTGDIWSVAVDRPADRHKVLSEETNWAARPDMSPDGSQIVFASYHGRQWKQLWLTTPDGKAPLPLSFGDYDRWNARWSPDGKRLALITNQNGNTELRVRDLAGGGETRIAPINRHPQSAEARVTFTIADEVGRPVPARVSILAADGRAYAPDKAWMHADDGADHQLQSIETHYFHCLARCTVTLPAGPASVWVQRGFDIKPWRQSLTAAPGQDQTIAVKLVPNPLPAGFGRFVSADLHVHMNYGGHYRATPDTLAAQARAEHLDVVYNLIVNKEERMPDIAYFRPGPDPAGGRDVLLLHSQEFHTSYWGHLGLLGLKDHILTPGFAAYQNSPLASAFPDNGTVADLAHAQGALVGYVHPFDTVPDPAHEISLTNALPADVANGDVDYVEVVGFSDHRATAEVWYRLLNLGFRLPAGAGTDAMTNYASLRGPVGMDRVFLDTGGMRTEAAVEAALKAGRTFASNGPMLGLELGGKHPGGELKLAAGEAVPFKVALRSPVAVDHVELVAGGKVVKSFALGGDRTRLDAAGTLTIPAGGWVVLRAWADGSDPQVLDIYPYATTSPIYLDRPGGNLPDREAALYFIAWLDRTIADAAARSDYRTGAERAAVLARLNRARDRYRALAGGR